MTQAEVIFTDVQKRFPDAEVAVRAEKSLLFATEQKRIDGVWSQEHLLVSSIADLHYQGGDGSYKDFTDIVKDEVDIGFRYRVEVGGYVLLLADDGSRRFYPRAEQSREYLELPRPQWVEKGEWVDFVFDSVSIDGAVIGYTSATVEMRVTVSRSGAKVDLVLFDASAWGAVTEFRFPFTLVGLTLAGAAIVSDGDSAVVGTIELPVARGAKGEGSGEKGESGGVVNVKSSAVELVVDLATWAFPVVIDPTITVDVSASANNFKFDDTANVASFSNSDPIYWGITPFTRSCGFLFTGVALANAVTISSAVINFYAGGDQDSAGTVTALIRANAADNPATCTTNADAQGRTRTTANVTWNADTTDFVPENFLTTPDFATVVQELVNRAGWASGNAQLIFFDRQSASNYCDLHAYGFGDGPAQLQVGYTTVVPRAFLVTM